MGPSKPTRDSLVEVACQASQNQDVLMCQPSLGMSSHGDKPTYLWMRHTNRLGLGFGLCFGLSGVHSGMYGNDTQT